MNWKLATCWPNSQAKKKEGEDKPLALCAFARKMITTTILLITKINKFIFVYFRSWFCLRLYPLISVNKIYINIVDSAPAMWCLCVYAVCEHECRVNGVNLNCFYFHEFLYFEYSHSQRNPFVWKWGWSQSVFPNAQEKSRFRYHIRQGRAKWTVKLHDTHAE